MAKVGVVARDTRLARDIKQTEHPHRRVGDYSKSIVQRLLKPTLQSRVEHAVKIIEVAEKIVDSNTTDFGHDGVVTFRNRPN